MTEVAVIKPDHIGDFVLSLPAFRALNKRFGGFDLFSAPGNSFLHKYFLPETVGFRPIRLAYLQKDNSGEELPEFMDDVARYSLVVFLRDDGFCREARSRLGSRAVIPQGSNLLHETRIQQLAVEPLTGPYSRSTMMWGGEPPKWPEHNRTVGISLSAGFFANKIAPVCWLELARLLARKHGVRIRLIGGPLEADEMQMMARMLSLGAEDVILGGAALGTFYEQVSACDVVVGADSGTMHLVSARVPVLGVFTSSPWQRFSPFGAFNRIIHATVPCSPCIQFSKHAFNACLSRECAALIGAQDIEKALFAPARPGINRLGHMLNLVVGASHVHHEVAEA